MKTSVIIPSRNERYLFRTIEDCLKNAAGDVEVLPVLDGYIAPLPEDPRVRPIFKPIPEGMRPAINSAAAIATGDFLMKLDAHCMVSQGYDIALQADCDRDWVVVPRRYALDPVRWQIEKNPKYPVDAHYLEWPWANQNNPGFHGRIWRERSQTRRDIAIDDEMTSQGSCWFMHKYQFHRLGLMQTFGYGTFAQEFQEIGFKCWLSGGRVVVNRAVHYSHWHKTEGRGYPLPHGESDRAAKWALDYWRKHPKFPEFVEKWMPIPTWPENWRESIP